MEEDEGADSRTGAGEITRGEGSRPVKKSVWCMIISNQLGLKFFIIRGFFSLLI